MAITPEQAATKWATNLGNSRQAIIDGVNAVTQAPGAKAAARKDYWLSRVQQNADKWARRTAAVSLDQWKADMLNKGVDRVGTGAAAAKDKMSSFFGEFLPYVEQGANNVRTMPKNTLQDSINRAAAMIQHNAKFVRRAS